MTAREEAARRFADLLGWTYLPEERLFFTPPFVGDECDDEIEFPAPDAPLHEHLEFVGRVAEAIHAFPTVTCGNVGKKTADGYRIQYEATVAFDLPHVPPPGVQFGQASAEDLSFAALLAGVAAKESKHV